MVSYPDKRNIRIITVSFFIFLFQVCAVVCFPFSQACIFETSTSRVRSGRILSLGTVPTLEWVGIMVREYLIPVRGRALLEIIFLSYIPVGARANLRNHLYQYRTCLLGGPSRQCPQRRRQLNTILTSSKYLKVGSTPTKTDETN